MIELGRSVAREAVLLAAEIPGEPVPWPRARRGRAGQSYMPRDYVEAKNAIGWTLREAYGRRTPLVAGIELGVLLTFYRSPNRRGRPPDVDNLAKTILDAGTGVVWQDDSQVAHLAAWRIVDPRFARTEVVVYRMDAIGSSVRSLDARPEGGSMETETPETPAEPTPAPAPEPETPDENEGDDANG